MRTEKQIELETKLNSQSREFDEALEKVREMAAELQKTWNEARRFHGKLLEKGETEESIEFEESIAMMAKYKAVKTQLDAIYSITRIYG